MNQFGVELCDPIHKCTENGESYNSEISFLAPSLKNDKSSNSLSNSAEAMSLNNSTDGSQNGSTCSHISYSDSDVNQEITYHVLEEVRSMKEKLTFEWVKTMSSENCEFNSSFDNSMNTSDGIQTDDSTESLRGNADDSLVFLNDSNDLPELEICFADAVTEENCDSGFSFSTRGSLANFIDDDFLDDDFELVFSTPASSAVLPDWNDVISEASELSQGCEKEIFVDFFDLPSKSEALQKVNEKWDIDMMDVDGKPRESVKVSFAPLPNLVTVHHYKKSLDDCPSYDTYAIDRIRFQNRIEELSSLISPILTMEHRKSIILRNTLSLNQD